MYLSSALSLSFSLSGHVFSSLWSNVSEVKSLKDRSLKVFSKCICHHHCLCVCLSHCFLLARSSLWSNVSKVKSLKDRSLKVFSKCICHCHCICLCLRICHCRCLFVGQVMFSHHSDQMSQRSKVSKIALWRRSLNVFVIVLMVILIWVQILSSTVVTTQPNPKVVCQDGLD